MKKFTLKFIQVAWVAETIAVIIFSMAILVCLQPEKIGLWHQLLPLIGGLIAAQGTAAGIGPLVSDKINKNQNAKEAGK